MIDDFRESELLSAYLDGELSAEERAQAEHLLAAKPAARKLLEELRSLSTDLKSLPRQKLGEDLSESVLRIAQRRMLTEPGENATPEKTGAASAPQPVPVYSTILRRLKNPRVWVWEIVIAAVAVLLIVYYPGQNADRNGPAPGNKERNIAMAAKPEETQAPQEPGELLSAPAPATVEMKRSPNVQITRSGRSDTSVSSEVAPAEKQAKALDETTVAGKAGEAARKINDLPRLEVVEEQEEGKFATAPEGAAQNRTDLAKKKAVNRGTTKDEKFAGEDMPTAAFKATAKQPMQEEQSPAPASSPSSGIAFGGQSKLYRAPPEETAKAGTSFSHIQPAAPPAQEKPADGEKSSAAPAGELLVVHCRITPEALKDHAFDKILADNGVAWSGRENPVAEKTMEMDKLRSLSEAKNDRAANKPERASGMGGVRGAETDRLGLSLNENVEIVYVEASPAQVEAMLKGLSAQTEAFKDVSITPATRDSRLQKAVDGTITRGEIAETGSKAPAYAAQTVVPAKDRFQSQTKGSASASTHESLGRARRIQSFYGDNAKASGDETEVQQQKLADTGQKGLPGTIDYGAIIAGQSGNAKPAGPLDLSFPIQPSASAGAARMERVLFVFQVMEGKNTGKDADKNAPADAARFNTPAADANPPKP